VGGNTLNIAPTLQWLFSRTALWQLITARIRGSRLTVAFVALRPISLSSAGCPSKSRGLGLVPSRVCLVQWLVSDCEPR